MMSLLNYLKLARINNPTGIFLLFLPCLYAIVAIVKTLPDPDYYFVAKIIILFFAGSFLTRSAGCIINDILDADFDSKVERSKNRPIANKTISKKQGIIFASILMFLAFLLLLQFNFYTIIAGFVAGLLILLYPLSKRFTNFPQLVLGFSFNFVVIMASLAIIEAIPDFIIVIFIISIIFTIIYDTVYAMQDYVDDKKAQIKSITLALNIKTKLFLQLLNIINFSLMVLLEALQNLGFIYIIFCCILTFMQAMAIKKCDFNNKKHCSNFFRNSPWICLIFLIALIFA